MKINRQSILFIILLGIAILSFLLFPNFERENFDPNKIEGVGYFADLCGAHTFLDPFILMLLDSVLQLLNHNVSGL